VKAEKSYPDETKSLPVLGTNFADRRVIPSKIGGLPHQGRGMNGRTPITAFKAGLPKPRPEKPTEKKEKSPQQKTDNQLAA
jgi:hypothetical protein